MFEFDNKYLSEEVSTGGTTINKDDCYECVITEAKIWKSDNSNSESLNLKIKDAKTEKKAWINLFYKKKNGEDIDFNLRHLSHLTYLIGVKPAPDNAGIINAWTNKSIGVFLTVKATTLNNGNQGYEFSLQGFYDANTKLTAKEKSENLPPETYKKMKERFANAEPVELTSTNNSNSFNNSSNDDGFFPIDNDDIPF